MKHADKKISQTAVKLAESQRDRARVYAFRYSVYVEEMKKNLSAADPTTKQLRDELDDTGLVYYMEMDDRIVTTLRVNLLRDGNIPDFYRENYGLARIASLSGCISMTSRLMISPRWRNSMLLGRLLSAVYVEIRNKGISLDFCYCAPHLVNLYEHLGYRRYKNNFIDPEVGYRIPLVLLAEDVEYLRFVRSPFYRLCKSFVNAGDALSCFLKEFSDEVEYVSAQSTRADNFWQVLAARIHDESIPLFHGLDPSEIDGFLQQSSVIDCRQGDAVIREGDMGQEMFLVLAGAAEISKQHEGKRYTLATLGKGHIFGEMAFLSENCRSADVVALTDMKLLVLSRRFFSKVMNKLPEISSKVLLNLAVVLCDRLQHSTEHWMDVLKQYRDNASTE